MRFPLTANFFLLLVLSVLLPVSVCAAPFLAVGDFQDQDGNSVPEFVSHLETALVESGVVSANSTAEESHARYRLSGLVEKKANGTSFSALLTDNFHLEPEVFLKGRQVGGHTSGPAAGKLAASVAELISNQSVSEVEVSGDSRLTPNAIMALAQIFPGEQATPQKIIAARVILDNCGLFERARIYLTPGTDGRKVRIAVREKRMIVAGEMPGPGMNVLDNILGPPDADLPEFPAPASGGDRKSIQYANCTGCLAYHGGHILEELGQVEEEYSPEMIEELVDIAAAIRDRIASYDNSCRDMCILLMKLCSVLDSRTVRNMIDKLQHGVEVSPENPSFTKTLSRIEFLGRAQAAAQEAQTILAARIFSDRPHSPVAPWVLYSLGEQAIKAEDITKAAPLLAGAVSVSSLPVSPEMLITAAKAQYSNLDPDVGDAAVELLRPLLAEPDLSAELRREITGLGHWGALCETVSSVGEADDFALQLKKGDALILLDRPDLAEPLFHDLHSSHPDDARPFIGFARLAFQRTGNLLSVRPYLERAERLSGKDRFFYELALAYKIERITGEALPTIHSEGRSSEEAAATRFLLPKAAEYADGYERFNRPQALLIEKGIRVLDNWLAYPDMTDLQALDAMYSQTADLLKQYPDEQDVISACYYFSVNSRNRSEVRGMLGTPLGAGVGYRARFLQLNLLIREMVIDPSAAIAEALGLAGRAAFSDEQSRGQAVALQADAHALLGIYSNSTAELERARSLYALALDLSDGDGQARLLNNQACVNLALGRVAEADDIYDEAQDRGPQLKEAVVLGKVFTAVPEGERRAALNRIAVEAENEMIRAVALELASDGNADDGQEVQVASAVNGTAEPVNPPVLPGMSGVLLQEYFQMGGGYDNYNGLQLIFEYESRPWLLPSRSFPVRK
ncbi:cyclic nucleotide-binding protein [Maridesulfovibrio sp. FT414]|uniref:cyclic nucleotide-binding protein n=1 Tax=Maridesulfovibrio sp. FT414 TaxID=2979469 RepID=UPI003D80521E